jgi:hypothetical protein
MKQAFLLIIAALFVTSCKKDKVKPGPLSVFGKWELTRTYGSIPQPIEAAPGNGNIYVLKSDSTYVRYVNNVVQHQGRFSIHISEVRDSIRFGVISFTNPANNDAFQIRSKTILFGTSAADGPVYEYRKVQ